MSDLIPFEHQPPSPVSISCTQLTPKKPSDPPGLWQTFVDFVRKVLAAKSYQLTERFAEAEVQKREAEAESVRVDNEIKLLKAKQEYEQVQAEIRRQDLVARGEAEKAQAEADKLNAEVRSEKAMARIREAAAREIERRKLPPEEAEKWLQQIIDKIRSLGGEVEIPPLDEEDN